MPVFTCLDTDKSVGTVTAFRFYATRIHIQDYGVQVLRYEHIAPAGENEQRESFLLCQGHGAGDIVTAAGFYEKVGTDVHPECVVRQKRYVFFYFHIVDIQRFTYVCHGNGVNSQAG